MLIGANAKPDALRWANHHCDCADLTGQLPPTVNKPRVTRRGWHRSAHPGLICVAPSGLDAHSGLICEAPARA